MRTASLEPGTLYFVRLPYEGGTGYGRVIATNPGEACVEWVKPPNPYSGRKGQQWLTARSVVRAATAAEVTAYA